jgi:phage terminase small subunit
MNDIFKNLTPLKKRFCIEYLEDLNAAQAAIRAGYSPRHANKKGSQLRSEPAVAAYISQLQEKREKESAFKARDIIKRWEYLADHAEHDSDKLKALDMLAKHHGLYEKDNSHKTNIVVREVKIIAANI